MSDDRDEGHDVDVDFGDEADSTRRLASDLKYKETVEATTAKRLRVERSNVESLGKSGQCSKLNLNYN